ncbi:unnamed protein product [Parnassius apollo]|uniref:(apollo) hypothetical protein n=1 Tax=Parnassius apollo TaxID=110799 RepID=A0A8S3WFC9_PARAO|nr:unnamed protein product [Parnassius apollo]
MTQNAYCHCLDIGRGLGYAPAIIAENELGCGAALAADIAYGPGFAPDMAYGYGYGLAGPATLAGPAAYGAGPAYVGAGIRDIAVTGEMSVVGSSLVAG